MERELGPWHVIHFSWGSPEVSRPSKPCPCIKFSGLMLFGALSNGPASALARWQWTQDEQTHGVPLDLPQLGRLSPLSFTSC